MSKSNTSTNSYHIPALLEPTIEGLHIRPNGTYIDVTFGGGGHSRAIMERLGAGGQLYSFDQDKDALQNAIDDKRWHFVHSNFRYLSNFLDYFGIEHIDGLLADLGVSFHHFDEAERGFSFRFEGPLDMRMNQDGGKTAADIVNGYSEDELGRVFYLYGELSNARQIARKLVRQRVQEPIVTTQALSHCLVGQAGEDIAPKSKKMLSCVFQALRIICSTLRVGVYLNS